MFTKEDLLALAKKREEPAWFIERRKQAYNLIAKLTYPKMQRFSYQGWPLIKKENVFVKGTDIIIDDDQVASLREKGIVVIDFFQALKQYPKIMQEYLSSVIKPRENKILAYHYAFLNSGLLVFVPKGTKLKDPINIDIRPQGQDFISHILLVADVGSRVEFIEKVKNDADKANLANLVVEVVARPNSYVAFSSLDEMRKTTTLYFNRRAKIEQDAHVEWNVAFMNDCNTLGDLDSELVGEGSYAYSKAIAVTTGQQRVGISNRVTNRGPHSTGLINQRGVLLESSRLIFNGIGQIVHGAHGSKADQQNRVLMMSSKAHGDANPLLLIDENDVMAAHAASVGPVDPTQMYYLMSRGLPHAQAQRLVIRGFLGAVLDAVPSKEVRWEMIAILEKKLIEGQSEIAKIQG